MAKDHSSTNSSSHWNETLRVLMRNSSLNPRSLSLKAGLGTTAVRDMLEGRVKFPRYDTVVALAKALNITPARLMGDQEANGASPPPSPASTIKEEFGDEELVLLAELIEKIQETVTTRAQNIPAPKFAAMVASLYRATCLSGKTEHGDDPLTRNIDVLMTYEILREKMRELRQKRRA